MKRQRPKGKGKGNSPRPVSKPKSGKSAGQQQASKVAKQLETGKSEPVAAQKEIAKAAQAALKTASPDSEQPGGKPAKTTTKAAKSLPPAVPPEPAIDPKDQRWSELQLEVPSQQEDMACWVLVKQCGALGCEVVPGKSGKVSIHASYEKSKLNENTVRSTIAILEEYGLSDTLRSLKVKDIPQEDWLAKWKEGFEPFRVGTKFLICPVWRQEGLSEALTSGRIVILIEPGMAFGTGLHGTTQFCLRALESYPPHGDVLDVGTGSGILAMAAKMLNPKARVIGVDTDPVAIETAKTDLDFNELVGLVDLRLGSVETVADRTFDMILSNLTCEDIVALLPDYVRLLKPNGKVICAGILKEKMMLLESAIKRFPLNIEQSETFGNWVGVVLQR